MEQITHLFERLQWWQRPLVAALPVLVAALVLPMIYTVLVRIPMDVLHSDCETGNYMRVTARLLMQHHINFDAEVASCEPR